MKNKLLLAVGSMALLTACDASKGNEMAWFDHAVKTSGHQLLYMAEQLKNEPDTACFPRSIKEGKYRLEAPHRLDEWFLSRFHVAGIRVDR